jgi:hypothetical protein
MADYYSRGVVTPNLTLTPEMLGALVIRGATINRCGEDNVLDQLARGNQNIQNVYVVFEEGLRRPDEYDIKDYYLANETSEERKAEITRLALLEEANLFREILDANPNLDHICSFMRDDGFGGSGLYVTRTHFLYISDDSAEVIDGKIRITTKPLAFKKTRVKRAATIKSGG